MTNYSIVEYLGESKKEKCGYCKEVGSSNSHGFWAYSLEPEAYQNLINRNFRRSGHYCYLPTNKSTCCPMYTIKCDATNFMLTRSQKKILKRMNKFLKDGTKDKNFINRRGDFAIGFSNDLKPSKEHSSNVPIDDVNMDAKNESRPLKKIIPLKVNEPAEKSKPIKIRNVNPLKKKVIRLENKKSKLAAKGLTLNDIKPRYVQKEKSLEDFLGEEPKDGKHKIKVKLVESANGSTLCTLKLYQKYQAIVHNDPPERYSEKSYERFLVNSPLKLVKNDSSPRQGYGSFHYQYYLDDELIAVGVIDILPECISSVYFYYNPDYDFLSLGTYASLREIALVRELSKICPDLRYYYLGFYIPTCPKMRYKSNMKPSFLLCPEVFTWHLLDEQLIKEIDSVRYKRINNRETDKDAMTRDDLDDVLVLANKTAMKYVDYKRFTRKKRGEDSDEVFEYASLVGKSLSQKMLLYRC